MSNSGTLVSMTRDASSMLPSASTISIFSFSFAGVSIHGSRARVPEPSANDETCGISE